MSIKVVAFDADDTLWVNEHYFREAEKHFCQLLEAQYSEQEVMKALFKVEMDNLDIYGFGVKGFMLSMIETANQLLKGKLEIAMMEELLQIGKAMLCKPVELLDDVEDILKSLAPRYKLVLATKGDLLDQQRKLNKSGLSKYFHHVEVMTNKKEADYKKLLRHLDIGANEFMMIGNSLKSDIIPVVSIGAKAIYVPYEITWMHEQVSEKEKLEYEYHEVDKLHDVLKIL